MEGKFFLYSKTILALLPAFFMELSEALQSADLTDWATVALIALGVVFRYVSGSILTMRMTPANPVQELMK